MRLGEFIEQTPKIVSSRNILGWEPDVLETFQGVNDFLRSRSSFPNPAVNEMHEYLHQLMISGSIAMAESEGNLDTPTYTIASISKDKNQSRWEKIIINFSADYNSFVKNHPIYALIHASFSASWVRDLAHNMLEPEGSWARALAYRGETGNTIQKMAEYEELTTIPTVGDGLSFGNGLSGLDPKFAYPTQPLQPSIRFGINVLSRN